MTTTTVPLYWVQWLFWFSGEATCPALPMCRFGDCSSSVLPPPYRFHDCRNSSRVQRLQARLFQLNDRETVVLNRQRPWQCRKQAWPDPLTSQHSRRPFSTNHTRACSGLLIILPLTDCCDHLLVGLGGPCIGGGGGRWVCGGGGVWWIGRG